MHLLCFKTVASLNCFPHCFVSLLHRCPLVAVTATAAVDAAGDESGDGAAAACDSAVFGSMCLNVNSVTRTDVCDNQDPAKLYSLQPEASAS